RKSPAAAHKEPAGTFPRRLRSNHHLLVILVSPSVFPTHLAAPKQSSSLIATIREPARPFRQLHPSPVSAERYRVQAPVRDSVRHACWCRRIQLWWIRLSSAN